MLLTYLFLVLVFMGVEGCTHRDTRVRQKCVTVPEEKLVRDLLKVSKEWTLNVFVTPHIVLVNGAPVGRIVQGRLQDQEDDTLYPPLMDAILEEFSRRSDDPYREVVIYVDKSLPSSLARLLTMTVERTGVAPVFVMPYDFTQDSCSYVPPKKKKKVNKINKIAGTVLIRVQKDAILVDGKTVVSLKYGVVPPEDMDGFIILPLYKVLKRVRPTLKKDAVPVLHITVDSDPRVVKMVLFTAGKVGYRVMRTFRVLP